MAYGDILRVRSRFMVTSEEAPEKASLCLLDDRGQLWFERHNKHGRYFRKRIMELWDLLRYLFRDKNLRRIHSMYMLINGDNSRKASVCALDRSGTLWIEYYTDHGRFFKKSDSLIYYMGCSQIQYYGLNKREPCRRNPCIERDAQHCAGWITGTVVDVSKPFRLPATSKKYEHQIGD